MNLPASDAARLPHVQLMGRDPVAHGNSVVGYPLVGALQHPQDPDTYENVRIHSIQAEGTELTVNYCRESSDCLDTSQLRPLRGDDLRRLKLMTTLRGDDREARREVIFEVAVRPRPEASTRFHKYDILYREPTPGRPWVNHCDPRGAEAPGRDATAFLPGLRINSVNAAVEHVPAWTTLGCESGAIVTCLDWGYAPWNPDTGVYNGLHGHVFGACLQAKRAAYFVGHGDLTSYTRNGTRIDKRDEFGLGRSANNQIAELRALEALWSPQGAVCLNVENRRVPGITLPDGVHGVPPCDKPPTWTPTGKLATGPLTPAPD
ncbi:ADYC domain-containing protein [Corallococcus exiguus]|uniref:ADYC domain-containing protein n=1 Tax=Corallococcus exiguus TaxID=83462 RepID=A0A7X5BUN7_9BACT|nr:ADYC domain-containing protein [Corallococcus exiguus]NBC41387.1 hypothetical protein [Corallococcus exiguus]TNV66971.1 hypothetical protein FH620_03300 [Corallococcus exiguus]